MVGYGDQMRPSVVVATLIDVCCVIAFVALGRQTHHDGDSVSGIWHTAWPFLAGLCIGLIAVRYWRRPTAIWPAGLGAWLGAAAVGMALRVAAGQGTALAFIAVALAFLGLFVLGWRCTTVVFSHARHTSPSRLGRG
jgi:peptidoglycan/LPS O-acetylase OafA/YrhL